MVKRKLSLDFDIAPQKAMEIVARYDSSQRRDMRQDIGRVTTLGRLDEEKIGFFYGECMVFSQISPEINEWIQLHFVQKGGTPKNYMRMRELFQFYQALTSDVDIRYELVRLDNGDYDIKDPIIRGNDFYIPKI